MHAMRWDVVCRVVDNYGDAGVCWRLARQLAAEHRLDVTLWLDRLATLAHLEPALDCTLAVQAIAGVTVRRLDDAASPPALPNVVVEGFGCGLPPPWLEAMARADKPPLWINLEYLSAEPWVDSVHGLASAHPTLPLTRYFWFPGFTARTGGLMREAHLLRRVTRGSRVHATPYRFRASLSSATPIERSARSSTRGPRRTRRSPARCPRA
jgi:uncharacterized repeat protein (TIGR03837 family)